ncbi:MAG: endolytic transglycosylase MltG, partial [Pseudomonadales bacterium]
MKKLFIVCMSLLVIASLLATIAAFYAWNWLNVPMNNNAGVSEHVALRVERGQTLSHVARFLEAENAIKHPRVWLAYATYHKLADKIHAGNYSIDSKLTPIECLTQLVEGEVEYKKATVIEGSRYSDLRKQFAQNSNIKSTVSAASDVELAKMLGLPEGMELEGWFYPDTIVFSEGTSDFALLQQGKKKMEAILNAEWEDRAENLPYESPYEALIMASIVEKETGRAEERQEIAGVFVRRLHKGMRLQTDPTVIYGLGDSFQGNLRHRHLRADTPYNTYTRHGLPPSPIALPGQDAIHAAL